MRHDRLTSTIVSGLAAVGLIVCVALSVAASPAELSVVETASGQPGVSAATITGRERLGSASGAEDVRATVYFRTDPAQRPDPQVVVVSADVSPEVVTRAVSQGDIVATVDVNTGAGGLEYARATLSQVLLDAQKSDTGPFGQLFSNPTLPPPSRITG